MKKTIKLLCICMSIISLVSLFSACGDTKKDPQNTVSREPYIDTEEQEFIDNDGNFDYKSVDLDITNDYVIIFSSKNDYSFKMAEKIREHYKSVFDLDLLIADDSAAAVSKEIIVGQTNRNENDADLKENQISVNVKNDKLYFLAGHRVTLQTAVEKFIRLNTKEKKVVTFDVETDFTSTMLDGYEYVWGDEFEGIDLDFTKWCFQPEMTATPTMELSYDRNTINVEDGRLKLYARRYFNPNDLAVQYRIPYSVETLNNMNYLYGYAEIRARIPTFTGVWPSFWSKTTDKLSGKSFDVYDAEIDIFEAFGSPEVVPNIIKWYKQDGKRSMTADRIAVEKWSWRKENDIDNQYHTYGFEWTEKEISMYVDGKKYSTFDIINSFDERDDMEGFHYPIRLIFNMYLFTEDVTWQSDPKITNFHHCLPGNYFIDYIRLYQKPGVGELYIDETPNVYTDRK